MAREQRWIILAKDGRHVTLGRDAAPTDEEVAKVASALAAVGLAGWYVILDGDYWARRKPVVLTMIQPLAHAAVTDWPPAVAAFEALRMAATSSKVRSSPSRMAGSPVKACQRSSETSQ